jgi:phage FluMu gp28-like protein
MLNPRTHFLPYQLAWIGDNSPVAIGEKSRRIGWTYASAFRAVERRLRLGTNLYYTSADLTAAREFVDYCKVWADLWDTVAEDHGLQPFDDDASAFVLRFPHNDARIVAGSSNPKFFRSKGGDADADEFAFHRDPRELYKAMQPTSIVWGHQLRLWSTHNGEGSFFNHLVKGSGVGVQGSGKEGARRSVHRVTLLDAVEQGLVEKIKGLAAPSETARRDFIEEVRASCPDEDAWNEEYLCRPGSEQRALLSYALIQSCETDAVPSSLNPEPRTLNPSPNPLHAGFDVGRKHDRSVLWVVEKVGDVLWTRTVRVLDNVNFTAQEEMLASFMLGRAAGRLCIDSTGIGAMLAERLVQRFGHRVEAVHFTAPVKSDLAMPLLRLFQDKLIRIPSDADIREDLHKVRKIVTTSNNVRLDADRGAGGHADRFWALALACHAALDAPNLLPAPLARKPLEW